MKLYQNICAPHRAFGIKPGVKWLWFHFAENEKEGALEESDSSLEPDQLYTTAGASRSAGLGDYRGLASGSHGKHEPGAPRQQSTIWGPTRASLKWQRSYQISKRASEAGSPPQDPMMNSW